ncbi:DUF3427 domain-containing protein [Pediococcus pentosaceus]|uniref:DUF3427 domain-containing protein n=1 Tax=Pediococcus pentosaceus TaxID=1255 RepID=UPI001ED97282|nr:DUF3427 domain-containing protein [Pediococcus pentosaceus]
MNSKNYDLNTKFTLYQKYTRRQVNSLLGWPTDQSSAIYGYKEKMGFCPMFVTYQKRADIPDELNHNNIFYNSSLLSCKTLLSLKRSNASNVPAIKPKITPKIEIRIV